MDNTTVFILFMLIITHIIVFMAGTLYARVIMKETIDELIEAKERLMTRD